MNNWQIKKLGEVCSVIKGKKPELYKKQTENMLPYLGARFMRGFKEAEFALIGEKNSVAVSKKDLVIICDGSKSGDIFSGFEGILSSTMGKMSFDDGLIEPSYLKRFLDSNFNLFNGSKKGAAIPHLDFNVFKNLEIPLPPLDEQKEIVKMLDEKMGKIEEAKRLRAEALADTEKILPQTLHEIFEEGKKNGWKEKTIEEIVLQIKLGFACGKQNEVSDGVVHLRTHNISLDGEINLDKIVRIPQKFVDSDVFTLKKDDIIFNNTNSAELVGKTILIHEDLPYAFSNHLTRIRFDTELVVPAWILYVFQKYWTDKVFEKMCTRWIGQAGINQTALKNIKILIPSLAEQQKIVAKLDTLSEKVRTLRDLQTTQFADLKSLEKAYLREAFSKKLV